MYIAIGDDKNAYNAIFHTMTIEYFPQLTFLDGQLEVKAILQLPHPKKISAKIQFLEPSKHLEYAKIKADQWKDGEEPRLPSGKTQLVIPKVFVQIFDGVVAISKKRKKFMEKDPWERKAEGLLPTLF